KTEEHRVIATALSPGMSGNYVLYIQEAETRGDLRPIQGQLTRDDPLDRVPSGRHHQVQQVTLEAGRMYQFDLMSKEFGSFLRLEDAKGHVLAQDDDGGEGLNARIIHPSTQKQVIQAVLTSAGPGAVGAFTFRVQHLAPKGAALAARTGKLTRNDPLDR